MRASISRFTPLDKRRSPERAGDENSVEGARVQEGTKVRVSSLKKGLRDIIRLTHTNSLVMAPMIEQLLPTGATPRRLPRPLPPFFPPLRFVEETFRGHFFGVVLFPAGAKMLFNFLGKFQFGVRRRQDNII